jgi:carbamoyl-phosphate synthase large subunit
LEICRSERIGLVIPTNDHELPVYASQRQRFTEQGTAVAISAPQTIEIGRDKVARHRWLRKQGFPTVSQTNLSDALAHSDRWPFPLLVKPRFGSGSVGVAEVKHRQHLEWLHHVDDFVVQTKAVGIEYTTDIYIDRRGRCACAVPRRRLEVRAGEVSKGLTVRFRALQDLAASVGEALPGAYGVLNVQIFHDREADRFAVIEINPRFGGGYPLSWRARAPFPVWLMEDIAGAGSRDFFDGWQDGLLMLRYDQALFVEGRGLDLDSDPGLK